MERFSFTLSRDEHKRRKGSGNQRVHYRLTDREMFEKMAVELPKAAALKGLTPVGQPDYNDHPDGSLTANVKVHLISSVA